MAAWHAIIHVRHSISFHDVAAPISVRSLSQLIGSTLALEYMRAEYVAPLGASSLIFNFLFARFLVGTPVTSTDIYVRIPSPIR